MNGSAGESDLTARVSGNYHASTLTNFITAILINPRKNCGEHDSPCAARWKLAWATQFFDSFHGDFDQAAPLNKPQRRRLPLTFALG
jgi:hypothetical protein